MADETQQKQLKALQAQYRSTGQRLKGKAAEKFLREGPSLLRAAGMEHVVRDLTAYASVHGQRFSPISPPGESISCRQPGGKVFGQLAAGPQVSSQ